MEMLGERKDGSLRFYVDGKLQGTVEIIDRAESRSSITCEICGKPVTLHHRGGWLKTLCEDCASKNNYQKSKPQFV